MKTVPRLRSVIAAIALFSVTPRLFADWKTVQPGWRYEFPRDHHAHTDFQTEWWYFTGNLFDASGRRFGYEVTFFRQGIRPPEVRDSKLSRFVVDDLKFAHFTVTDVAGQRFRFQQKTSRGAFDEAGFDDASRIAWIDSWKLLPAANDTFDLVADGPDCAVDFHLRPALPPAVHGENGVSAKASGSGHASHYYSVPRLQTAGQLRLGSAKFQVSGDSWFDHEWATNQLASNQIGWNWLCLQLEDGGALMLYQMRLNSGAADPASSGTLIPSDGSTSHLPSSAFKMTPLRWWKSKATGANYPVAWRVELPGQRMEFTVGAALDDQELALVPLTYWEGAVDGNGLRDGKPIRGRGYMELTGYAAPLRELSR